MFENVWYQFICLYNSSFEFLFNFLIFFSWLFSVQTPLWPFCKSFRNPDFHYVGWPNPYRVKASNNITAIFSLKPNWIFGVIWYKISSDNLSFGIVDNTFTKPFWYFLMAIAWSKGFVGNSSWIGSQEYEFRLMLFNSYIVHSTLKLLD